VDPRIRKLADVLVQYSAALAGGDVVVIKAPPIASPLVVELYHAALEAGAHPHVRMGPNELAEIMLKYGSDEQLEFLSPSMYEADSIDVSIAMWGEVNTKALTNADSEKHAKLSAARRPIVDRLMERFSRGEYRWTGTLFPTNASAQDAGMALPETGGLNKSGLHWDMVCDLRPGGKITVDGDVVHEDGKFTTVQL